ncbi:MAG: hypothetical protein MR571_03530 [Succinatimonas sp.]|nr:hypothetical protein [Succinatimonas sp.]
MAHFLLNKAALLRNFPRNGSRKFFQANAVRNLTGSEPVKTSGDFSLKFTALPLSNFPVERSSSGRESRI